MFWQTYVLLNFFFLLPNANYFIFPVGERMSVKVVRFSGFEAESCWLNQILIKHYIYKAKREKSGGKKECGRESLHWFKPKIFLKKIFHFISLDALLSSSSQNYSLGKTNPSEEIIILIIFGEIAFQIWINAPQDSILCLVSIKADKKFDYQEKEIG